MVNIRSKLKRAIGIQGQILNMVKGLGKYTFECSFIFLNSLLRASILYASEAYYNLKEKEIRSIEKIEEALMKQIFGASKSVSIHLLYLESGQVPARFIIQKLKLNFLYYILQQSPDSLLYRFFEAQRQNPTRGD